MAEKQQDRHGTSATGQMTTWRDALINAERQTNDLCTAAVLERWKWWRPRYSSGYAQGVRDAQAVVFAALLDATSETTTETSR